MAHVNLLASLPRSKRNITARAEAKDPKVIAESRLFGQMYFDGPREYGYGGYKYDGRWASVARDMIRYFELDRVGQFRVLDVGCAKGFLVHEFMVATPKCEAFGLDISPYAIREQPHPPVVGRLHLGSATRLPFPDKAFDLAVSINTIHNLDRGGVVNALRELTRVSRRQYVQVDSYYTPEQKALFEEWVLTARFYDYPAGWLRVFEESGYRGDYNWTVVE